MLKSLLSRLFSKPKTEAPAADDDSPKNRSARVALEALHEITFRLHGDVDQDLKLVNVSSSGMAFVRQGARIDTTKGSRVEGTLTIRNVKFPVTAKVAHVGDSAVGCQFVGDLSGIARAVEEYFKIELGALKLAEINPAMLKEEPDGSPRLFRGNSNCELFLVEKNGAVVRFQLSVFGNYVEGARGKTPKFGFLTAEGADNPLVRANGFVRLVPQVDPSTVHMAEKMLQFVPNLPEPLRAGIRGMLRAT